MNKELLDQYVELHGEIKAAEAALDVLKTRKATMETEVLADFTDEGIQSVKATNGTTVFIHRSLRASVKGDRQEAAQVLVDVGLGDLVRQDFNLNTLSSWVREQDALGVPLPDPLTEHVAVAEFFSARVRKS